MNKSRKSLIAWCFYDWANSAFPTIIITFIFSAYFTKSVAANEIIGTSQWGLAMSISAIAVALAAPVLGAISDQVGRRKPWLAVFTIVTAFASFMLWTVKPNELFIFHALFWIAVANFTFEMSMVFYNAMLPSLVPKSHIGRWSGWGWGLGYIGGLVCLAIILIAFVQADPTLFDLDKGSSEDIRIVGPFVAVWMVLFALPMFWFTPDSPLNRSAKIKIVVEGIKKLSRTVKKLRDYRAIVWFLFARMFYTDGLNTLFAFGGIYAAGTFGLTLEEIIIFGISINVTAGLGSAGFAWLDDKIGAKKLILLAISGVTLLGAALLIVESKFLFWVFGLPLGLFVGPAQSASRSLLAQMAPEGMHAEFFGLFALSGKATAFLGPACLSFATIALESQRAGMATILIFLLFGIIILTNVRVRKH